MFEELVSSHSMFVLVVGQFTIWLFLLLLPYRLGAVHATFVYLSAQSVGVGVLSARAGVVWPLALMLGGMVAIICGLAAAAAVREVVGTRRRNWPGHRCSMAERGPVVGVFVVVLIGTIYHYAIGGIPILMENPLEARFQFDRSGLMGLPGRIAKYGWFFVVLLFSAALSRHVYRDDPERVFYTKGLLLAIAGTALSLALVGHKGSILQLVVVLLLVSSHYRVGMRSDRGKQWLRRGLPLSWLAAAATGAAVVVVVYASVFIVKRPDLGDSALAYLGYRVFEVSGRGFFGAVRIFHTVYDVGWGAWLLNDLRYFVAKFGIVESPGFLSPKLVSALWHGKDVMGAERIAPMTLNVLGRSYLDFLWAGPIMVGGVFGAVFGWLYYAAESARSSLVGASACFGQLVCFWVGTRGNYGYIVLDSGIMLVFFALCYVGIASVLHVGPRGKRNDQAF